MNYKRTCFAGGYLYGIGCPKHDNCFTCPLPDCQFNGSTYFGDNDRQPPHFNDQRIARIVLNEGADYRSHLKSGDGGKARCSAQRLSGVITR